MRKSLSIFSTAALVILSLLVTACPVAYKVLSPYTYTQDVALTGFGDNTTNGVNGLTGTHTINMATVASTGNIPQGKITNVNVSVTITDYNWWIVVPIRYSVNGGPATSIYLWNCGTGDPQFNGTRVVSFNVPYGGTGNIELSADPAINYYGGVTRLGNLVIDFSS